MGPAVRARRAGPSSRRDRELALYRSVIGQPRQEDSVALLAEQLPEDEWERATEELRIELSPP